MELPTAKIQKTFAIVFFGVDLILVGWLLVLIIVFPG